MGGYRRLAETEEVDATNFCNTMTLTIIMCHVFFAILAVYLTRTWLTRKPEAQKQQVSDDQESEKADMV